ncbi:DNA-binding protein, partial [Streptococcus suis]
LYEMRSNPKYRGFVINPTSKQVFIHLQGFEEFLRWKQRH